MTSAIIIVDGTTQIALTPETDWERDLLKQMQGHKGPVTILSGSVYECRGGYWRAVDIGTGQRGYESVILRLDAPPKQEAPTTTNDIRNFEWGVP